MPQISESVTINRPVMAVFRVVVDASRVQEWQPDVTVAHASEDRLRVGVMITQERNTRALGWKLDLNADIIDYVPNRLIEYRGVLGRFPVVGRIEFESSGGTMTVRENLNIRMFFPLNFASPLVSGAMRRRTQTALNKLKNLVESEA
jgi:uncharacterized membrane protein